MDVHPLFTDLRESGDRTATIEQSEVHASKCGVLSLVIDFIERISIHTSKTIAHRKKVDLSILLEFISSLSAKVNVRSMMK